MPANRDHLAVAVGALRFASGLSFLVDPVRAGRWWGADTEPSPRAALLLRSMGYRDALVGGLLLRAGLRGTGTGGWFLASAGADASDLVGGLANHGGLDERERSIGLWAPIGAIGIALVGAARARKRGDVTNGVSGAAAAAA